MEESKEKSGIIGLYEAREKVVEMKDFYVSEYKRFQEQQQGVVSSLTGNNEYNNKWYIKAGQTTISVGLAFVTSVIQFLGPVVRKAIGKVKDIVTNIGERIFGSKAQAEEGKVTADFIDEDGNVLPFSTDRLEAAEKIENKEENYVSRTV